MHEFGADSLTEAIGYTASLLVLVTFSFSNPVRLRLFALASNVTFIIFAFMGGIHPIMLLHMILLPINAFHLTKLILARPRALHARTPPREQFRPDPAPVVELNAGDTMASLARSAIVQPFPSKLTRAS